MKTGQKGELALEGLLNQELAFEVQAITPVSSAQDGRNFFRVEATLENPSYRLRPGMSQWLRLLAQHFAERRSAELRMQNFKLDQRLDDMLAFSGRGE